MGNFILETIEKEHNRMALKCGGANGDILLAAGRKFSVEETIDRDRPRICGIDSCDPFVLSSGFFLTAEQLGSKLCLGAPHPVECYPARPCHCGQPALPGD